MLAESFMLFLQRIRYPLVITSVATLVAFVPVKPFLAHLLLNMELSLGAWPHLLSF